MTQKIQFKIKVININVPLESLLDLNVSVMDIAEGVSYSRFYSWEPVSDMIRNGNVIDNFIA